MRRSTPAPPLHRARPARSTPGKVRVIGGRWKRTPLTVVDGPGVRPTPDRVRETVFNWLGHAWGGDLAQRAVLDLFAGSGALGIEAASRGADPVVLVERHPAAVDELRALRGRLDGAAFEIVAGDALRTANALVAQGRRFDCVFLDPPFGQNLLAKALPIAMQLCKPAGFVYLEDDQPMTLIEPMSNGLDPYRADRAGDVFYHLLQRKII